MVHSKKVPEAVNLQAVQAALRMLQMNTTQEGVENYFGNELSLLAKMAGFQTNISPPFIDKASPFAKQTEVIMPKYKSKKRRANGDGSYSVLQNGKIRYQAFAMDEQENLLYFDKDDRLTYRGSGSPELVTRRGKPKALTVQNVWRFYKRDTIRRPVQKPHKNLYEKYRRLHLPMMAGSTCHPLTPMAYVII